MSKKIKLAYKDLFVNFAKMLFAGCLTFVICIFVCKCFESITLPKYVFETIKIISISGLCFIVYILLNLALKMSYAKDLISRLKH